MRRLGIAGCVALGCLLSALISLAQSGPAPAGTVDTFDMTFRDWMKENNVEKGTLAVSYRGRLVLERGYGGRDPGARVLLASLSKAITGRCIAQLTVERKLEFDSKVGDILAPFFKQHGEPADRRIKDATVEQLLVHRAGFPPAPRDLMTPAAVDLLQKAKSPATATPSELLVATLSVPLASAPGEAFRYSNIGYLVLGVMIETVTGESYESFCGRSVLGRSEIKNPTLDPEWRSFSSFGGWRLGASEYLAFLKSAPDLTSVDTDLLGRNRIVTPSADRDGVGSVLYGLGQFERFVGRPTKLGPAGRVHSPRQGTQEPIDWLLLPDQRRWHAGSWGVAPDTIGMLAMEHESGASWFVWFTRRPGKDSTDALMERLAALPTKITVWPEHDLFLERGLARRAR
jgi:hypothetical protein